MTYYIRITELNQDNNEVVYQEDFQKDTLGECMQETEIIRLAQIDKGFNNLRLHYVVYDFLPDWDAFKSDTIQELPIIHGYTKAVNKRSL